jgi:hypothetical protein
METTIRTSRRTILAFLTSILAVVGCFYGFVFESGFLLLVSIFLLVTTLILALSGRKAIRQCPEKLRGKALTSMALGLALVFALEILLIPNI